MLTAMAVYFTGYTSVFIVLENKATFVALHSTMVLCSEDACSFFLYLALCVCVLQISEEEGGSLMM